MSHAEKSRDKCMRFLYIFALAHIARATVCTPENFAFCCTRKACVRASTKNRLQTGADECQCKNQRVQELAQELVKELVKELAQETNDRREQIMLSQIIIFALSVCSWNRSRSLIYLDTQALSPRFGLYPALFEFSLCSVCAVSWRAASVRKQRQWSLS